MPSLRDFVPRKTETVERIAKGVPLKHEDWIVILEDRLNQMKPLLEYFPNKPLGNFPLNAKQCRLSGGTKMSNDEPYVQSGFFDIGTRMIHVADFNEEKLIPKDSSITDRVRANDGKTTVWGLEKKGRLLLIDVELSGNLRRNCRVSQLSIRQARDIREVLRETEDEPREIWMTLAGIVEEARDFRRELYEKVQRLTLQVVHENLNFFYSPPINDPLNRYHIPKTSIAG